MMIRYAKLRRTGKTETVVGRMARGTESKKARKVRDLLSTQFNLVAVLTSSYHHLPKAI